MILFRGNYKGQSDIKILSLLDDSRELWETVGVLENHSILGDATLVIKFEHWGQVVDFRYAAVVHDSTPKSCTFVQKYLHGIFCQLRSVGEICHF